MRSALALLVLPGMLLAADRTFILETQTWTPYTPTYLGSGLLGLSSTRLGTDPAQSFMAGVYAHGSGDVPRQAAVPAWNSVDVYNGAGWLNAAASVQAFRQTLDMFNGVLKTSYNWVDGGRTIGIRVNAFVSRADPELGVMEAEFYPIAAVELGERSALQRLIEKAYRGYLRPPFNVPVDDNLAFLTGAGAFLHRFIFGYAGLRFSANEGLSRKVVAPLRAPITRLVPQNVSVRGRRVDTTIPGGN